MKKGTEEPDASLNDIFRYRRALESRRRRLQTLWRQDSNMSAKYRVQSCSSRESENVAGPVVVPRAWFEPETSEDISRDTCSLSLPHEV